MEEGTQMEKKAKWKGRDWSKVATSQQPLQAEQADSPTKFQDCVPANTLTSDSI